MRVYPAGLNKEEVAARAGYEANGRGFNNALGRLRTLKLVQGRGELRANDNLFGTTTSEVPCFLSGSIKVHLELKRQSVTCEP